jgi:hypothetical protein
MIADSFYPAMGRRIRFGFLILLATLFGSAFTRDYKPIVESNPPPGPDRFTIITVEYTAYEWWMISWQKQEVHCSVVADHEGPPTLQEVSRDCGEYIAQTWWEQDLCRKQDKMKSCKGFYTYNVDSWSAEKEIPVYLPAATAWLTLEDCEPVTSASTTICEFLPTLVITGQEPLPNENILRVEGIFDGQPFSCEDSSVCKLPLQETSEDGAPIEFWAYSSYGDSSPLFTGQVRVRQYDTGDPDQLYWYVDVLSSQWQGQPVATCADSWESFPPVSGPPDWLASPKHSEDLSSDIPYTYLAANLILQGVVDASACPDGGLVGGAEVNQCGLEKARPAVNEWQDRFDKLIHTVAKQTGVPGRLLKNLFARESQFWPGLYQGAGDVGLGQLTENGADTTLFWNSSFYNQFCPLVLSAKSCGKGYLHLGSDEQLLLRRALVASVNATCEDCPLGLDLSQADFSVAVFAHTMLANCEQAGQVVRNLTGDTPGKVASYEDLWKFTLVNYNAGTGCLADAITGTKYQGLELTWENLAQFLPPACQGAIDYVNDISQ